MILNSLALADHGFPQFRRVQREDQDVRASGPGPRWQSRLVRMT